MKIYRIFILLALLLPLSGCELDYAPENQLVDENVYKNERTAQAAVMGCYVRLNVFLSGAPQDQNNYANNGYTIMYGDIGTDNLTARSTADTYLAMETSEYTSNEHDGLLYNVWHWGYNAIDMANNVIDGINRYGTYAADVRRKHIAEAKFVRAYVYFQLLCMFGDGALMGNDTGDGVVMRLAPYNGYNPDKVEGRESNEVCWRQVIGDLEEAIPDLDDDVPSPALRVRANKAVAKALLSRVYLYKGTYTNNISELMMARDLAREVLDMQGYVFANTTYELTDVLFPSNEYSQSSSYPDPVTRSNELIFFEPSRISTDSYPNGLYYYRKTTFSVPKTFRDFYDTDDVRNTELLWSGSRTENVNDITSKKYSADSYCDVIYMRLSEVKLTYAETLARVSGNVSEEAVSHLNDVYTRAFEAECRPEDYRPSDFASTDEFIRRLLIERNRELAFEGHYRWDIIRTGNIIGDSRMGGVQPSRWNMPVPDYEIRISYGAISQNTGY